MDISPEALATDGRRASAMLAHHLADNGEGVFSVLQEAADQNRIGALVMALMDLAVFFSPALQQPDAVDVLRRGAARLATREEGQ